MHGAPACLRAAVPACQVALRKRHHITAASKLEIQAAEKDLYVAKIDDKWVGPGPGAHCLVHTQ